MNKVGVSIIIPSRDSLYLQETVDDLLDKAKGEIEIIVVFDGLWPKKMIKYHKKITVIHHGTPHSSFGMRESINRGASIASGQYIMKVDEHCAFDESFDVKLAADCNDNWVVTPRKYDLDVKSWDAIESEGIDNMAFAFPTLNYIKWRSWYKKRKEILIDDCMGFQGSCYFMTRKHWDWLGGLDTELFGGFHYEPQEICLKTWLGGGRVVTNKKTWYAHWHRRAKEYNFSNKQYHQLYESKSRLSKFVDNYWLNNCWEGRLHDFEWLIEKFWPVPYWPQDWKQQLVDEKILTN